jgi:hypothetical protein
VLHPDISHMLRCAAGTCSTFSPRCLSCNGCWTCSSPAPQPSCCNRPKPLAKRLQPLPPLLLKQPLHVMQPLPPLLLKQPLHVMQPLPPLQLMQPLASPRPRLLLCRHLLRQVVRQALAPLRLPVAQIAVLPKAWPSPLTHPRGRQQHQLPRAAVTATVQQVQAQWRRQRRKQCQLEEGLREGV